jgi:transmembrane sensor
MSSGMERVPDGERRALALRELVHAAEEPARTSVTLARARAHFVDALARRAGATRTGIAPVYAVLLGFAASVALVCGALLVTRTSHVQVPRAGAVVTYAVEGVPGTIGAWHSAPPTTPLSLRFSEGTNLLLSANASLRVVQTDEHGATVALERGRLHARVEHRDGTRWGIDAGPYHVRVTGTEFDVEWDPGTASFGIKLLAGSVQVTGCNAGARVAGGQALRLRCESNDSHVVAEHSAAEAGTAAGATGVERLAEAHPGGEGAKTESPTALTDLPRAPEAVQRRTSPSAGNERIEAAPPAKSASPSPDAPAPAASDEHPANEKSPEAAPQHEQFAATAEPGTSAHSQGVCERVPDRARAALDAVLESGTPDATWAAIQCARRAGLSSDAEDALRVFRERYGADPRRATAAFLLGKLAFARGASALAARWFETSRREAPGGQLARESAGRLIEAWQRAGDTSAAIRAARDYLAAYPEGPHARLARSLLEP